MPSTDSGTPAAIGFSQQSGIPYAMGIIRNQYMGEHLLSQLNKFEIWGQVKTECQ